MSEFNNRVDAQRKIIRLVNCSRDLQEELFGLSGGAIQRWARVNRLDDLPSLAQRCAQLAEVLPYTLPHVGVSW